MVYLNTGETMQPGDSLYIGGCTVKYQPDGNLVTYYDNLRPGVALTSNRVVLWASGGVPCCGRNAGGIFV